MTGRAAGSPPALPYIGVDELDGRRHVMVDGAARPGSALVLSHWPSTPTPREVWRDLSAEIALAYLDEPSLWDSGAQCVTLDHLDEDGLAALFVVSSPPAAREIAQPLVAFARAGDFGVTDVAAARSVFTFQALSSEETSPWRGAIPSFETDATRRLLAMFEELVTDPDRFEWAWAEGDRRLSQSVDSIRQGDIELQERRELALAVVRINGTPKVPPTRLNRRIGIPLHPFAIHTATEMPRVLVLWKDVAVYYDRYETWVRFVSRSLPRRTDLTPLARRLEEAEGGGAKWSADPPGAIVPVLATEDGAPTSIEPREVEALLVEHLASAPPAWDPFAAQSPFHVGG